MFVAAYVYVDDYNIDGNVAELWLHEWRLAWLKFNG